MSYECALAAFVEVDWSGVVRDSTIQASVGIYLATGKPRDFLNEPILLRPLFIFTWDSFDYSGSIRLSTQTWPQSSTDAATADHHLLLYLGKESTIATCLAGSSVYRCFRGIGGSLSSLMWPEGVVGPSKSPAAAEWYHPDNIDKFADCFALCMDVQRFASFGGSAQLTSQFAFNGTVFDWRLLGAPRFITDYYYESGYKRYQSARWKTMIIYWRSSIARDRD